MTERGSFLGRVAENRTLCRDHFQIALALPRFPDAHPGQFLQVLCRSPDAPDARPPADVPMLRRPLSIAGLRRDAGGVLLDILAAVVGPGTAWLSALRPGDCVDVLGPLGRPFSPPRADEAALLVAGGVGLPPIRWLGEKLAEDGVSCTAIYGARSRDLLPLSMRFEPDPRGEFTLCVDEFARSSIPVAITTDDGTCGVRGRVTDLLERHLGSTPAGVVYACGPEPMLKAVARTCGERGVRCELALERVMGCGMGTCQSCVVPVRDPAREVGWRYALCCTDGPVFSAEQILWNAP